MLPKHKNDGTENYSSETLSTVTTLIAKRFKDLARTFPVVHNAPVDTFYKWMKSKGKLGGQNKVPRLANDREYLDAILEVIGQGKV